MNKSIKIILSFAGIIALVLSFITPNTAAALTISPAKLELSGDPGATISGEFLLINEQVEAKTFYSSAENFEAQGETGTPSFTEGTDGLASWVKVAPEITLQKGEQKKVPFTITIPKDADAGGHFAAIFLSTEPAKKGDGQVAVGAKVGVLVLLRVSGDIKEGGGIIGFSTKNDQTFYTSLPVHLTYRFNNSGNDRVNPTGEINIKDTLWLSADTISANPGQGNVLPGSTRRFDIAWGDEQAVKSVQGGLGFFGSVAYEWKNFALGMYTAKLHVQYGSNGVADASKIFFVIPWQLLIVILVVLAIIYFILSISLKRYNRWIINKARSM